MRPLRLRLRTMMIAVAASALTCLFASWSLEFDAITARAFAAARARPAWDFPTPSRLGERALRAGRFQDAEKWYRTALVGPDRRADAARDVRGLLIDRLGYAEALAGQGRLDQAEQALQATMAEAAGSLKEADPLLILIQRRLDDLRGISGPEGRPRENSRATPPTP